MEFIIHYLNILFFVYVLVTNLTIQSTSPSSDGAVAAIENPEQSPSKYKI